MSTANRPPRYPSPPSIDSPLWPWSALTQYSSTNIAVWADSSRVASVPSGVPLFAADIENRVWVEGLYPSSNNLITLVWMADPDDPIAPVKQVDTVAMTAIGGDIRLDSGANASIAKEKEEDPGAVVLLNDDDDADKLHAMAVKAATPADVGGDYKLVFDSNKIRIWKDKAKTEEVISGDTKLETSGKAGEDSAWVESKDGTNQATAEATPQSPEDTVSVLWDSGPAIGGPVYRAAPGFEWKLDVNIVQIKLENMSIAAGTTAGVGTTCGVESTASGTSAVGMTAKAKVTITGHEVDGVQRGVRYMQTGFLQISTSRDEYNTTAVDPLGNTIKITHYLENDDRYLDQLTKNCTAPLNTKWPWYDATGDAGRVGFFEGANERGSVTMEFEIQDTPAVYLITDPFQYDGKDWTARSVNIAWRFELNRREHETQA